VRRVTGTVDGPRRIDVRFPSQTFTPLTPAGYLPPMAAVRINRPLILVGVLAYSILLAALRWAGVIGTTGTVILLVVMVADLVATHWLLRRRGLGRRPPS
jgi:hypothetical protein